MASRIISLTIVYITVHSGADQRKHQSSASLAFVRGIHRSPMNSPHKWPVTRKMFSVDDIIILTSLHKLKSSLWVWCLACIDDCAKGFPKYMNTTARCYIYVGLQIAVRSACRYRITYRCLAISRKSAHDKIIYAFASFFGLDNSKYIGAVITRDHALLRVLNHIIIITSNIKLWDIMTHPYPKFNGGMSKPPLIITRVSEVLSPALARW